MTTDLKKIIAIDTETTGIDFCHGARPYIVTTCDATGKQRMWHWDVDPLTRMPQVNPSDVVAIRELLEYADILALQNAKFDARALQTIGIDIPWSKVRDTLFASHLLASNHRHDLTSLCIDYLGVDILPYENKIRLASIEARKIAKRLFPDWRLAKEDDPDMPSVKTSSKRNDDKPWKNDMWLPRLIYQYGEGDAAWLDLAFEYAKTDSECTVFLWLRMEEEIRARKLDKIYAERLKLIPIAYKMEHFNGITISKSRTYKKRDEYKDIIDKEAMNCVAIAEEYGLADFDLPKGATPNDSLREFIWGSCRLICERCGTETRYKEWANGPVQGNLLCAKCEKKGVFIALTAVRNPCLSLEKIYDPKAKSASPTLNKEAMDHYIAVLEPGKPLEFIKSLTAMRSRQTAVTYMGGYEKFWVPIKHETLGDHYRLYPFLNPTGTDTLRWSSNNPNGQNISKKESFNLRYCFCPAMGREWFSMDGKNLELRIPAYRADERELIAIFENPNQAPYYGSYHLAIFDTLHPELYKKHGKAVKELFESTWYQWVKNGNFAVIYGAQEKKANKTYHVEGAFAKIKKRFPKIAALAEQQKQYAHRYGYVQTVPDKLVDPERGYPILCGRSESGAIMPTTTLNYHISGTAMQWTCSTMIECDKQLQEWQTPSWDGFLSLQIHDELLFDFPKGTGPEPWKTNLPRVRKLQYLMEQCGERIGVPTPVSVEYHADSWETGLIL